MDKDFKRRDEATVRFHHTLEYLKRTNPNLYKKILKTPLDEVKEQNIPAEALSYGDFQAINAGDISLIRAYKPFAEAILSNSFDAHDVAESQLYHVDAITKVAFGQVLDNYCAHMGLIPTLEDWRTIVRFKTNPLFEASVLIGITLGAGTDSQKQCAKEFSDPGFMAFQGKDDGLDYTPGKGHIIGSDLMERKVTLHVAKFFELSTIQQQEIFNKAYGNENATSEDVQNAIAVMKDCNTFKASEEECKRLVEIAKNKLDEAKPPFEEEPKEWFKELFDYVGITRTR
jgi:geranylgeranyl pyrophosphate synthase